MKRIMITLALAVMLVLASVVPAFAVSYGGVNMDYEGELDTQTGKPVTENVPEGSSSGSRVSIGDGAVFDRNANKYCYTVNGAEVQMNVPSGVITTGEVSITVPEGTETHLFLNGAELPGVDLTHITGAGKYVLRFSDTEEKYLTFTIVGAVTGLITGYQLPDGFNVTAASLNDASLEASSYVDMSQEGVYVIKYQCSRTGIAYTLAVTIDNTPPVLKLEAVKDGYAKGPVDISDVEPGATVSITLNGEKIKKENVLTESGNYEILLTDSAGNTSSYSFVIGVYFNAAAGVFIAVLVLLLAALVVYLLLARRKIRVR